MKIHCKAAFAAIVAAMSFQASAGLISRPIASGEGEASFGISAGAGVLQGMAHEYVYVNIYSRNFSDTLSRLDWEFKSIPMVGVNGSARWRRLSLNLGFWSAIDGSDDDGTMKDYDWANLPEFAKEMGYAYSETSSRNDLTDALLLDINVSFELWRDDVFSLDAFAGIRCERWNWDGYGAEGGYGFPGTPYWEHEHTDDSRLLISYEQLYDYGYFGVGASARVGMFEFSGYAAYAPSFSIEDTDVHYERSRVFENNSDSTGQVLLFGLAAKARLTEALSLSLVWDAMNTNRGTLHSVVNDEAQMGDDGEVWAGAKLRTNMLSLAAAYAF